MFKKAVLIFFILLGIKTISYSQITSTISDLSVLMEIVQGSNNFQDTVISSSESVKGTMVIEVDDVSTISKIQVKMGSTDGGNEFFSETFDFDATENLPSGISYKREGKVIYLGIGTFTGLNHFFAEAKLEDAQGALSAPVKYQQ